MTLMRHERPVASQAQDLPLRSAALPLSRTTTVDEQPVAAFVNYDGTISMLPYSQMTADEIALFEDPQISPQINAGLRDVAEGRVLNVQWEAFWAGLNISEDDD